MAKENHLYYIPTKEGMEKIKIMRAKVIELDDLIDELTKDCPKSSQSVHGSAVGRSISIAKTKLEECRQRAIEAIVRGHCESQQEAA